MKKPFALATLRRSKQDTFYRLYISVIRHIIFLNFRMVKDGQGSL